MEVGGWESLYTLLARYSLLGKFRRGLYFGSGRWGVVGVVVVNRR